MARPGAVLSLHDKGKGLHKKRHEKSIFNLGKCFVRNGIKISLTKCFIWQAEACSGARSLYRKKSPQKKYNKEHFFLRFFP